MTGPERNDLAELKKWLYGEDGQGGDIGAIQREVSALSDDMAFLKGAVRAFAFIVSILGLGGIGYVITAAVASAT